MEIGFDLHTHSKYSDGKNTLDENIKAASNKNIILGASEHGPGHFWFGVKPDNMAKMKKEIIAANGVNNQRILHGVEANLMGKHGETDIEKATGLDYYLVGYHKGIFPNSTLSLMLTIYSHLDKNKAVQMLTDALIAAMDDERIIAITHPGEYIDVDIARLAEQAAKKGVLLEINQRHPMKTEDLVCANEKGACFILSSDAHKSENIAHVENAILAAKKAGIADERIANSPLFSWEPSLRITKLKNKLT